MKWFVLLVVALTGFAVAWSVLPVREWLREAIHHIDALGAWGIIVYFLLYFCLACATFPSTPLNVGAAIIFPFAVGFSVAWMAGALASMATFVFSRHIAKDWTKRKLESFPQCESIIETVESQGFKMVLLARLNPLIPASIKNFGFGLTSVEFWKYACATLLGQLPIVLSHVFLGWAGNATLLGDEQPSSMHYIFIAIGVVLSVAMLVMINWYGKRQLAIPAT